MAARIVPLLATFFYIGKCPVAPGTLTSIVGAFAAVILCPYPPVFYIFCILAVASAGFMVSGRMERLLGEKDPSCVVIDEAAGVLVAFFMLPPTLPVVLTAFFLFRAFDMFKIYPANKLEESGGALGIMADDLLAGFYTNIVMQAAVRWAGLAS